MPEVHVDLEARFSETEVSRAMLYPLRPDMRAAEEATRAVRRLAVLSDESVLALEIEGAVAKYEPKVARRFGVSVDALRAQPEVRKLLVLDPVGRAIRDRAAEALGVIEADLLDPAGGHFQATMQSRGQVLDDAKRVLREAVTAALLLVTLMKLRDAGWDRPRTALATALLERPGYTTRVWEQALEARKQQAPVWAAFVAATEWNTGRAFDPDEAPAHFDRMILDPTQRRLVFRWEPAFRDLAIAHRKPNTPEEKQRILREDEAIVFRTSPPLEPEPPRLLPIDPAALKAALKETRADRLAESAKPRKKPRGRR